MPGIQDIPGTHTARNYVLAQATANAADIWPIFTAPGNIKITGARWIPAAAVTGAATNNFALAFQNRGHTDSTGTTALTTTKTYDNAINSVANDPESYTLTSTAADLLAVAGDVIALVRTVNASGLASPDGAVEIDYVYR
jgi:hypothetical protein